MSAHTATTLAYVRTSAGVVKVDPGESVPSDVVGDELDRLAAAGVVAPMEAPAPPPAPSPAPAGKRGKAGQGS